MFASTFLSQQPVALRLAAWLLLFALAIQGCGRVVVQALGTAHMHRTAVAEAGESVRQPHAPSLLGEFLAWREARHDLLRTHGSFKATLPEPVGHRHDGLQRHHHDADDATVLALDGPSAHADAANDSGTQGQPGALNLPWGPAVEHPLFGSEAAQAAWPSAASARWSSAWTRLMERPPRA